jgi:tRNA A-37 threonylcarbamoyl transferase component Bud32
VQEETKAGAKVFGGRYAYEHLLGRGGVGEVFLAHDRQLDRWVAIKRLHPETDEQARRAESAMVEARNLAALQHPSIVTIYDFLVEDGDVLVVMEYVHGRTLEAVINSAPITFDDFFEVALQSLEGLAAAHAIGMLHRDIKPSNIMLTASAGSRMQVKILDLGLSKIAGEPSTQTTDQTGALLGSIYTMAPEQFEQRPLDVRTDLYALGCVLYHALAGRPPFEGATTAAVMAAHLQGTFAPLAPMRPDLSPAACAWTERLLAREMEDRPRSASEAAGLLRAILGTTRSIPLGITAHHYVPPPMAPQKSRMVPIVAVMLLALAALGAGGWWFAGVKSPSTTRPGGAAGLSHRTDLPVVQVTARDEIKALLGKEATVEGEVGRVGESKNGQVRYLNFVGAARGDLSLVFFLRSDEKEFTMENLERYVGKTIRASGLISDYQGMLQMEISGFDQIKILD